MHTISLLKAQNLAFGQLYYYKRLEDVEKNKNLFDCSRVISSFNYYKIYTSYISTPRKLNT